MKTAKTSQINLYYGTEDNGFRIKKCRLLLNIGSS